MNKNTISREQLDQASIEHQIEYFMCGGQISDLQYITNLSDDLLEVLLTDGPIFDEEPIYRAKLSISSIKNSSERLQLAVVKDNAKSIADIENPTELVQWTAASFNPMLIYGSQHERIPAHLITDTMRVAAIFNVDELTLREENGEEFFWKYEKRWRGEPYPEGNNIYLMLENLLPGLGDIFILCKRIGFKGEEMRDHMIKSIELLKNPARAEFVAGLQEIDFGETEIPPMDLFLTPRLTQAWNFRN